MATTTSAKPPILTLDVSRILDVSPRRVQQLEGAGVLVAIRTSRGQRLFDPDQVENVRRQRDENRRSRE